MTDVSGQLSHRMRKVVLCRLVHNKAEKGQTIYVDSGELLALGVGFRICVFAVRYRGADGSEAHCTVSRA